MDKLQIGNSQTKLEEDPKTLLLGGGHVNRPPGKRYGGALDPQSTNRLGQEVAPCQVTWGTSDSTEDFGEGASVVPWTNLRDNPSSPYWGSSWFR